MSKVTFFSILDNYVNSTFESIVTSAQVELITNISVLLISSFTLYYVFFGFLIISGKIQSPLMEVIFSLGKMALILVFMKNSGGYLNLVNDAVLGLQSLGTGGNSGIGVFDSTLQELLQLGRKVEEKVDTFIVGETLGFITFIAGSFGLLAPFLIVLIAKITTFVLLAFAPLFLFCLLWGWLKDSFAFYFSALLSNALLIIGMSLVMKAFITLLIKMIDDKASGYVIVGAVIIGSYVLIKASNYLAETIKGLVKVSVDRIPMSQSKGGRQQERQQTQEARRTEAQTKAMNNLTQKIDKLTTKD